MRFVPIAVTLTLCLAAAVRPTPVADAGAAQVMPSAATEGASELRPFSSATPTSPEVEEFGVEQREIGELDCMEDELAALLETYHFHEFSLRGSGRAFHYRNGLLVVRNRQSVLNQLNLKLLLLEWDGGIQAVLNRARGRDALHEAERACVALDYVAAEAWCLDAIRLDPGNDQAKELRLKVEFELGKRPAPVDDETVAVMQARPQRRRELVEAEMAALEESHDWCTRHNAAVEGLAGMQFTLSVPPSRVRKVLTWIEWIDDDSLRERWRLRLQSWLP